MREFPVDDPFESLDELMLKQLEQICAQFQQAWREGTCPNISEYLNQWQFDVGRRVLLDNLLKVDLEHRRDQGEHPTPEEYKRALPREAVLIDAIFGTTHSRLDDNQSTEIGGQPVAATQAPSPPISLGRYQVRRLLGRGGFGTVYLAYDAELERQVAIKVPHAERVATPADAEAYVAEARLVARLDHPAIVPVYDAGRTPDGRCFVVSKFMSGTNLEEWLRQTPATHVVAARIIAAVADALHYAHLHGVVHRDVKPANILLDIDGKPYLVDFGLALHDDDFASGPRIAGTPAYMSPEQARGEGHVVDGRSDIFSLGVVLYELLTRKRPFRAASTRELLWQIVHVDARPPRQLDDTIPRELERICLKTLAKRNTDRYTTARDLSDDLRNWLESANPSGLARSDPLGKSVKAEVEDAAARDPVALSGLTHWDFGPTLTEKRRDYCGRQWLLEAIVDWLRAYPSERALLITGPPGSGKSAFLAECAASNVDPAVISCYFCQAETPATLHPGQFLQNLAADLMRSLPAFSQALTGDAAAWASLTPSNCKADPVTALELGLLGPLGRLANPPQSPRVVLIDALDECLLHSSGMTILELLAPRLERFPDWLHLVATTRDEPQVTDRLGGIRLMHLGGRDGRNLADVRDFIRQRFASTSLQTRLAESGLTLHEACQRLEQRADGNFLFARHALDCLERGLYSIERLHELPPSLPGLFNSFFERRYASSTDFSRVRSLLEVLIAACEPLSEEDLGRAASVAPRSDLPLLLEELAPFLTVFSLPGEPLRYKLFHKSLVDWLTDRRRARVHWLDLDAGHSQLADFCRGRFAACDAYSLAHWVPHLLASRRFDDLEQLLTDFSFWQAKSIQRGVFDLARDLQQAIAALPAERPARRLLRVLREALLRGIHLIRQHPETLLQCLWNSAWWSDAAESAPYYEPAVSSRVSFGEPANASRLLEQWRAQRGAKSPPYWLRSLRPPPRPLGRGLLLMLRGHQASVTDIAFSNDGRLVVSASDDATVRVWDAEIGEELQRFDSAVATCDFHSDSETLVSGSRHGELLVRDLRTGREKARRHLNSTISDVRFAPDGSSFACAMWNEHQIRIYDTESLSSLQTLSGHSQAVLGVAWHPDGRRAISHSTDQSVRLWSLTESPSSSTNHGAGAEQDAGEVPPPITLLALQGSCITRLEVDETGTFAVCGSTAGKVHVLDLESQRTIQTLDTRGGDVSALAICGRRLATGTRDGAIRTWDLQSGDQPSVLLDSEAGQVNSLAFSPDGRKLVSGHAEGGLCIWDASQDYPAAERLRGHRDRVRALTFSSGGKWLVSGGADAAVFVWDAETGLPARRLEAHARPVLSLVVSRDGRLLATGSSDNSIGVWDFASGQLLHRFRSASLGHTRNLHFLDDSTTLAYVDYDHQGAWLKAHFWNTQNGHKTAELSRRHVSVFAEVRADDASMLAIGRQDGQLEFRQADTGALVRVQSAHGRRIVAIDVAQGLRRVATVAEDGFVHICSPEPSWEIRFASNHVGRVNDLALSPDGGRLATVADDGTLCIWDTVNGDRLARIHDQHPLCAVAFSKDGDTLLTACAKTKSVCIRDAGSLESKMLIDIRLHAKLAAEQEMLIVTHEEELANDVWSQALIRSISSSHFYASSDTTHTVITDLATGRAVAWFPIALRGIVASPEGRRWAGRKANHVYLLELERA